jgi:hypothetical protein
MPTPTLIRSTTTLEASSRSIRQAEIAMFNVKLLAAFFCKSKKVNKERTDLQSCV